MISLDLTPDESVTDDTLDMLVHDNPWLIKYLVDGATEETYPNGDIAVIFKDEETQNDSSGSADDPANNNGNGNGKNK